jgi:tetratricopeptide (TPR) repeat protein
MSQLTPAGQKPHSADPAAPVVEPGFEVALHLFWEKNRNLILLAIAAALLAIVAREGLQYFSAQREQGVQAEYAKISDQPAKLAAFAEAHSGHPLAAVAWLQLADAKFAAGDFTAAAAGYQKAVGALQNQALLSRARLGAAISQVRGSDRAGGEAALKALSADATLPKGVRAEATYDLAALAAEAGNAPEVRKLVDQVSRIDPTSPWSQRATMLLAGLPPGSKPADEPATGLSFKPGK